MLDAITTALNSHQEKQEKQSDAFENFLKENEDLISEIENNYKEIANLKKHYEGYAFVEDNDSFVYNIEQKVVELDKSASPFEGYDFGEEVEEMFPEIK